jgi:hypothetical protein
MAKNRKNQAASIRFGPALKASFLCLLIAGSAIGYVWQKGEIGRLGQQILEREKRLTQLQSDNKRLTDQLAILHSPVMLDQRERELNLGLVPAQPMQVVRLDEPLAPADGKEQSRQLVQRPMAALSP